MSITNNSEKTPKIPALMALADVNQLLDEVNPLTVLISTGSKAESCFTEAVRKSVPASTDIVLKAAEQENVPEKVAVSFFDSSAKKTIPGFLTRKFDDGDVVYNAFIDDKENVGSISLEVLDSKLWIHAMKNNSPLSGVGKALIEAAKQEAKLHSKKEIGLIALGDSHTFYAGCGFAAIPSKESDTINSLLKANYLASKEKGIKVSTSYLGPLEMSFRL